MGRQGKSRNGKERPSAPPPGQGRNQPSGLTGSPSERSLRWSDASARPGAVLATLFPDRRWLCEADVARHRHHLPKPHI